MLAATVSNAHHLVPPSMSLRACPCVCVCVCISLLSAREIRSQPHRFHYVARILNLSYAKINAPKRSRETTSLKPATPISKDLDFFLFFGFLFCTFALVFPNSRVLNRAQMWHIMKNNWKI